MNQTIASLENEKHNHSFSELLQPFGALHVDTWKDGSDDFFCSSYLVRPRTEEVLEWKDFFNIL